LYENFRKFHGMIMKIRLLNHRSGIIIKITVQW